TSASTGTARSSRGARSPTRRRSARSSRNTSARRLHEGRRGEAGGAGTLGAGDRRRDRGDHRAGGGDPADRGRRHGRATHPPAARAPDPGAGRGRRGVQGGVPLRDVGGAGDVEERVSHSLLARRHWVFDLDGTITVAAQDVDGLRAELDLPFGVGILEALAALPAPEAAWRRVRVAAWETEHADAARAEPDALVLLDALAARGV